MRRTKLEEIARRVGGSEPLSEEDRRLAEKALMVLSQARFESSGSMFICGWGGEVDEGGLPDYVTVCSTYGADYTAVFKKVARGEDEA